MKTLRALPVLLAVLLSLQPCQAVPMGDAVFEQGTLRMVVIKPTAVTLNPGGKPVAIRIQGSGLDSIKKIQIIRADKMIHNVTATYRNLSRGIGEITVKANADAEIGTGYRLVLVSPSSSAQPPIQVSVDKPSP